MSQTWRSQRKEGCVLIVQCISWMTWACCRTPEPQFSHLHSGVPLNIRETTRSAHAHRTFEWPQRLSWPPLLLGREHSVLFHALSEFPAQSGRSVNAFWGEAGALRSPQLRDSRSRNSHGGTELTVGVVGSLTALPGRPCPDASDL